MLALQAAPNFSGRWTYDENGQSFILDITHDTRTNRVAGTMSMFGNTLDVAGQARGTNLVIESIGGLPIALAGSSMTGKLDGVTLMMILGDSPRSMQTIAMKKAGAAPAPRTGMAASSSDFNGRWEAVSDDKTNSAILELTTSGTNVTGMLTLIERGYFSGRESVTGQTSIRGTERNGVLDVTMGDPSRSATILRRGKYLVIRSGDNEQGFARPGESLVESAAGSDDAAALERAIAGKVFSSTSQASGRGAFVGGRVRLAVCANHRLEYDSSNLASTPGGLPGQGADLGSSVSRRGTWSVVLFAGAPALRAEWQGTGTSYSLTAYFTIRPATDGRSANVDGVALPVSGSC